MGGGGGGGESCCCLLHKDKGGEWGVSHAAYYIKMRGENGGGCGVCFPLVSVPSDLIFIGFAND